VFLQGLLINQASAWPDWVGMRCEFTERIESLVRKFGRKNSADLCMAYVRSFPWVTTLVLGVETLRQLEGLLALAAEPVLTQEQVCVVQGNFVDVPAHILNPSQW
jgi:aryl-alcohol dehydrogenase-like predicted oxidoreductase